MKDGSPSNLSIARATGGSRGHEWSGPIVCLGKKGLNIDAPYYSDLEITDMRDLVDYFEGYNEDIVEPRPAKGSDEIPGVRTSCVGDITTFDYEQFTSVAVPSLSINVGEISSVSRRVGFPLLVRKYSPDILWKDQGSAYVNVLAPWLYVNVLN
ncbi:hypothetical protein MMC14_008440 [Varicellaria rhodocarpa]|nr:hypothetical protein [Varicellaria rhodocarpa]